MLRFRGLALALRIQRPVYMQTIINSAQRHSNQGKVYLKQTRWSEVRFMSSVSLRTASTTESFGCVFEPLISQAVSLTHFPSSNTNAMCITLTTSSFPYGQNVTFPTPMPWRTALPKKPKFPQVANKFPAFYGTQRFITVFPTAPPHPPLVPNPRQTYPVHALASYFIINHFLCFRFFHQKHGCISVLRQTRHILLDTLFKNSIKSKLIIVNGSSGKSLGLRKVS